MTAETRSTGRGGRSDASASSVPRFARDLTLGTAANLVAGLIMFLYAVIVSRWLGVEDYGLFQSFLAVYGLTSLFIAPLNVAAVHAVSAAHQAQRPLVSRSFVRIAAGVGALFCLVILVVSPRLGRLLASDSFWPFLPLLAIVLLAPQVAVLHGTLAANLQYGRVVGAKALETGLAFVSGLLLVQLGAGVAGALAGTAIGCLVAVAWLGLGGLKQRGARDAEDAALASWRERLSGIRTPILVFTVYLTLVNVPMLVARVRLSATETGLYSSLFTLRQAFLPFAATAAIALYVRLVRGERGRAQMRSAVGLVVTLGLGFTVGSLAVGHHFMRLLFGDAFSGASAYLWQLGITLTLTALGLVLSFADAGERQLRIGLYVLPLLCVASLAFLDEINIATLLGAQIVAWTCFIVPALLLRARRHRLERSGATSHSGA